MPQTNHNIKLNKQKDEDTNYSRYSLGIVFMIDLNTLNTIIIICDM